MACPSRSPGVVGDVVGFAKLPLWLCRRPAAWPVWNHAIDQAVRFWTKEHGGGVAAPAALASVGSTTRLSNVRRAWMRLGAQVRVERDVARHHLGEVIESFYDRDWRRAHQGFGDPGQTGDTPHDRCASMRIATRSAKSLFAGV